MHLRSIRSRVAPLASALLAGLLLAATTSAQPGPGGPGPGPGHGMSLEDRFAKLGLPAETQAAVKKVFDEARPEGEKLAAKVRAAHEGLRALLEKDPTDEAAVMKQSDVVGAALTEHRKHEMRTLIRARALLSPEDRAELNAMLTPRRGRGR